MSDSTRSNQTDEDRPIAGLGPPNVAVDRVARSGEGQLMVHLRGGDAPIVDVRVTRYFPWSMPDMYISIRDSDGRELAMLKTLDELDPASRRIVEDEFRDKAFNPKILRVLKYTREFGTSSMSAETDRGEVIFQFQGRHDVRLLSPTRALFRDADGNTYEVPDITQLDPASQKHLAPFF